MKQLNVRDETHLLCRELSLMTGRSLLDIAQAAFELYRSKLEEKEAPEGRLVDRLLREAAGTIEMELGVALRGIIQKDVVGVVNGAIEEAVTKLQAERTKESERLASLLQESEDLPPDTEGDGDA